MTSSKSDSSDQTKITAVIPGAFMGLDIPFVPCPEATEEEQAAAGGQLKAEFPWWPLHASFSNYSCLKGLRFQPRSDDVIISTFVKSGTTWTTFIAHLIRSGCDVNFEEISQVVTEITWAHDMGVDVDAPQLWSPRVFKAHLCPSMAVRCHPGARMIYVVREPKDVLCSCWNFFQPKARELWPGTAFANVDDFAASPWWQEMRWVFNGHVWMYISEAWEARHDAATLLVFYEDLKDDPAAQVARMARHMGVHMMDEAMREVVRCSSHEYMLAHASLFDEHWIQRQQEALGRWGSGGHCTPCDKVTANGKAGAHKKALAPATIALMDDLWSRRTGVDTGFGSYGDMLKAFRLEQISAPTQEH